jgi:hypothetical protein
MKYYAEWMGTDGHWHKGVLTNWDNAITEVLFKRSLGFSVKMYDENNHEVEVLS